MSLITCPTCGARLPASAVFCGNCGARLQAAPPVSPTPYAVPTAAPPVQAFPHGAAPGGLSSWPPPGPTPVSPIGPPPAGPWAAAPAAPPASSRRVSRRSVLIGGSLAGLALAGGGGYWLWRRLAPPPPPPQGTTLYIHRGHQGLVNGAAWSPDGKRIASAGYNHTVQVWDAADGGHPLTYGNHSSVVFAVAWSPDGKRSPRVALITPCRSGTLPMRRLPSSITDIPVR